MDGSLSIPASSEPISTSPTTEAPFSADDAAFFSVLPPETARSAQGADALTSSPTENPHTDDDLNQISARLQSSLTVSTLTPLPSSTSSNMDIAAKTQSADDVAACPVSPTEGSRNEEELDKISPPGQTVLKSMSLTQLPAANSSNVDIFSTTKQNESIDVPPTNIVKAPAPTQMVRDRILRRTERVSAPVDAMPRYALPTASSSRRHAETLRMLNARRTSMTEQPSTNSRWLREPTRPRSPNFKSVGRSSYAKSTVACPIQKDSEKVARGRRASVTLAKSPVFRSRGRSRRASVSENVPPKFTPNPTPAFLTQRNVLPNIKLNAKTMAAMEHRAKPRALPRPPIPSAKGAPHASPTPTVPQPFSLRGVEQHELYCASIASLRAREEEEDRERRKFYASPLNEAIMNGPTFVPSPATEPLTEPIDLLPFASERSERTRAYEARQRERVERLEQETEEKKRARLEEEERLSREEYNRNRFTAQPVPKSTYVPHSRPRLSSSSFTGSESKSSSRENSSKAASSRTDSGKANSFVSHSSKTSNPSKIYSPSSDSSKVDSSSAALPTAPSASPSSASFQVDPTSTHPTEFNSSFSSDSQSVTAVASHSSHRDISATELSVTANVTGPTEDSVVCETSEPQTPANDTVSHSNQDLHTPDNAQYQSVTTGKSKSSTSETTDSPNDAGRYGWMQRVRKSFSPLLGGPPSSS